MPERRDVIDPVLLGASGLGARLFRNSSGVAHHTDGAVVRYGIASPGGSDIIGWTPRLIRPEHVGQTFAVFTAIEAKTGKQRPTQEQHAFLEAVRKAGGIAFWGRDPEAILELLRDEIGGP